MMKNHRPQKGFTLPLILVTIATVGVVAILFAHLWMRNRASQIHTNATVQASMIIKNLQSLVLDSVAWKHTLWYNTGSTNSTFNCLLDTNASTVKSCDAAGNNVNGPTGNPASANTSGNLIYPTSLASGTGVGKGAFAILSTNGTVYYDATVASNGFTLSGEACTTFNAVTGNDACPLHAQLYWRSICSTYPCGDLKVYGYLIYNGSSKTIFGGPFNPSNYSFVVEKNQYGNVQMCCTFECKSLGGDGGLTYVTQTLYSKGDCYTGSTEIANDACDQALVGNPQGTNWAYDGSAYLVDNSNACAQDKLTQYYTCPGTFVITSGTNIPLPSYWHESTTNTIYAIGGGGSGAVVATGGGGGGGGAYSVRTNASYSSGLVPNLYFTIGTGAGGTAGDTFLCTNTANCATITDSAVVVGAKGGTSATTTAGGAGGLASGGVGTSKFSGGTGGAGSGSAGGGGGGAAGPAGAGMTGGASGGSTGGGGGGGDAGGAVGNPGAGTTGGAGGNGATSSGGGAAGVAGTVGGGGGGGSSGAIGGAGGNGIDVGVTSGGPVGGGGGAGGSGTSTGATGGFYGGGGGGAHGASGTAGSGGQGVIILQCI